MTTAVIEDWAPGIDYTLDQMVFVEGQGVGFINKMYRCIVPHTSLAWVTDWGNNLWEEKPLKGTKGDQGDAGGVGAAGPQGVPGANGANGAPGNDGIFSQIASQAEAQAGADNTKGMTPLRTKNAIDTQVPLLAVVTTAQADIVTNATNISSNTSRINVLEGLSPLTRARGEQRINNNQLVAQDIQGKLLLGENGKGNDFKLDGDGATSARIEVEIYREDDAEIRFTTVLLRAQFVNGAWYIARENTTVLVGGDDGVEFLINNLAGNEGQIQYTSDNMAGGNYRDESYVRYFIEEISRNF